MVVPRKTRSLKEADPGQEREKDPGVAQEVNDERGQGQGQADEDVENSKRSSQIALSIISVVISLAKSVRKALISSSVAALEI